MNVYDKRMSSLPASVVVEIGKIDELKGRWVAASNLTPAVALSLKRSALITSTGASTRIEGVKMTDQQIGQYLDDLKIEHFAQRDRDEVRGYYETLEFIFDHHADIDFSENSIKYLHSKLLSYRHKDEHHRGKYKNADNKVEMIDASGNFLATVFETAPAYLTPKLMQELLDWQRTALADNRYHPLLVLANFLVSFLQIHPFTDGNGRLSRLLTNYVLLEGGYMYTPFVSHEKLIEESKGDYYRSLRESQKTFGSNQESISAWATYFLNILLAQAQKAAEILSSVDLDQDLSPKQIQVWHYLLEKSEVSPRQIVEATGIKRITVNQILKKLIRLGRIKRLGQGRSTRYKKL